MAIEEEHECDEGSDAAWMATFADLMSLLLTFFVLLLSFANMDVVRFKVVLGSVREAFGVQFQHPGDIEAVSTSIVALSKQESSDSLQLVEEIMMLQKVQKFIEENKMENLMEASLSDRGVVIRIKGRILFRSGDSDLRKQAPKALEPVLKLTEAMDHQLSVEGHTDNRPIKSRKYPSNWELSTARAVATMRYLVDKGLDPSRVNVSGYADMRPLESNDTPDGRARNRRVEFIFLRAPDKEPISKEEIEAARVELEKMRNNNTLMDDPKADEEGEAVEGEAEPAGGLTPESEGEVPEASEVVEGAAETSTETEGAPADAEAVPEEGADKEKPDEPAATEGEAPAKPPVEAGIGPSLSPGIKASDVTPLSQPAGAAAAADTATATPATTP